MIYISYSQDYIYAHTLTHSYKLNGVYCIQMTYETTQLLDYLPTNLPLRLALGHSLRNSTHGPRYRFMTQPVNVGIDQLDGMVDDTSMT